jgi:hypothetical protein
MEVISKVKKVESQGIFNSNYGDLYKFRYEMEDGVVVMANHKKNEPYPIGSEVEYILKGDTSTGEKYGNVGKPKNNFKQFKGGSNNQGSFALSYAKDLAIAHINKGNDFKTAEILKVADAFNNWLKQN